MAKAKKKGDPMFLAICKSLGLPEPTPEHRFHPTRKWRIDYYFENGDRKLALEVEGGVWGNGRHTRGKGFMGDMEKYNEITRLGIQLIRTTPSKLKTTETINLIKSILL